MLSDMGGVYTLGVQPGTIVRDNLIHDVNAYAYGGWGLYTDEGSTGIVLESNIVYRCQSAGFHQHYGRENVVRNNIFAFNQEGQLARTRVEPHLSLSLSNNIVVFDSGNLLVGNWGDDLVMDRNLYFDTRQNNSPLAVQLQGWRARGHDLQSIIADPLFADPKHFDFRLSRHSPALALGFQPFTLDAVGPRPQRLVHWVKQPDR
jgi:parallel beta-helix repeat protein